MMTTTGRKKLSGQAALSQNGDGWQRGQIRGPWTYVGFGPKDGPDIVLDPSVDSMGVGSMWADITRGDR